MTDQLNDFAGMSKRDFLQKLGMVGGSAALYTAMQGLDLVHASTMTSPPQLSNEGAGKKIIILGAGLSGLATALELTKKGYDCEIYEARGFSGGRCQSARKGSVIEELGGERQVCNFEHNQYLNIGPWRIPAEHKAVIHYCRELGIELEPMINKSNHAFYYSEKIDGPLKGKRIRQVEVDVDRAGNIQELVAKATNSGALDDVMTAEDKERLLEYLASTALLDRDELTYRAGRARGHKIDAYPGPALEDGEFSEPFDLAELLKVRIGARWKTADHPAAMFQAKGGMDQIPFAMERALKPGTVTYNSEVTKIVQNDDSAEVTVKDTKTGDVRVVKGDYVFTTIPFSVLKSIENDFSDEMKDSLTRASSAPAYKIGLQFTRRFWEEDDMIYGGSSYSDIDDHYQTSYPSSNMFGSQGDVMLANYKFGGGSVELSNNSIADRIEHALMVGEKLHPGNFRKHFNGQAISMSWHKDKYSLGAASSYRSRRLRTRYLPIVLKGEKRVIFSGGGISPNHSAWMTGAIEGAWYMIKEFDKRVGQA